MSAARNYVFTFNNYPEDLSEFRTKLEGLCTYFIYGKEVAPTTGTPHLQGYFQLKEKERITGLVKKLPGVHLVVAKGGFEANKDYCSKEGEVTEFGLPATSGKRKGLAEAAKDIKEGKKLSEVAEESPEVFAKFHRGLEALSSVLCKPRDFKTEVHWFWGPTGTGKSRECFALGGPDAYWKPATNKWWNGYEGQECVIIDDYRRDFCTFAELLRLFDRYPLSVETKGGTRTFRSRVIYITTPKDPESTWEGRTAEDLEQLLRRIEEIRYFPPGGCASVQGSLGNNGLGNLEQPTDEL